MYTQQEGKFLQIHSKENVNSFIYKLHASKVNIF